MSLQQEFERIAQTIKEKVGKPIEVEILKTAMTMDYKKLSFSQTRTLLDICKEENLSCDISAINRDHLFLFFSIDRI